MATILIVEDNPSNQLLMCDLLNFRGHRTICCSNGEQMQQVLQEEKPDLILMDIQLPKVDGISLIQELRNTSYGKDIPIIAVTALVHPEEQRRILESGCNMYISKPINTRTFVEQIETLLEETKGEQFGEDLGG